jgi:hypothetical protein
MISISNCTKLRNINAFSTNSEIDLSLNDTFNEISALLPNKTNTTGGQLIITGAGDNIEEQNKIIYT